MHSIIMLWATLVYLLLLFDNRYGIYYIITVFKNKNKHRISKIKEKYTLQGGPQIIFILK